MNKGLLWFWPPGMAEAYLSFIFVATIGLLQVVAAREHLVGLSFFPQKTSPIWGMGVGGLLLVGAFAWFFGTKQEMIFQPGLAGTELFLLFSTGSVTGLGATLVGSSILQTLYARGEGAAGTAPPPNEDGVEVHAVGSARLYVPSRREAPVPAVCLVPSPLGDEGLDGLALAMAREGFASLAFRWDATVRDGPSLLARLSAALDDLARQPQVDARRMALIGFDLGADVALCAARGEQGAGADGGPRHLKSADGVQLGDTPLSVVALAPLLDESVARFGMDLLRETTLREVVACYGLFTSRSVLRSLQALRPSQATHPCLLVYGAQEPLVSLDAARRFVTRSCPSVEWEVVPGAGHFTLVNHPTTRQLIGNWLKEHL